MPSRRTTAARRAARRERAAGWGRHRRRSVGGSVWHDAGREEDGGDQRGGDENGGRRTEQRRNTPVGARIVQLGHDGKEVVQPHAAGRLLATSENDAVFVELDGADPFEGVEPAAQLI